MSLIKLVPTIKYNYHILENDKTTINQKNLVGTLPQRKAGRFQDGFTANSRDRLEEIKKTPLDHP